jgi:hypothetical protein
MSVYIAPKKWPTLDDNPSSAEVALNLRRVFNTLNDHDQAINTLYANGTSASQDTINQIVNNLTTIIGNGGLPISAVSSFNGATGAITFFASLGTVNNQIGAATYTTQGTDNGAYVILGATSPIVVTLNNNVTTPWYTTIINLGSGTATLTPASGTINNFNSVPVYGGFFAIVAFDGTNYWAALVPIATTTQYGVVMPDGVTIKATAGVISVPTATYSTLGLIEAVAPIAHEWINSINLSGIPQLSQPAIADISGLTVALALLAPIASPVFTGSITTPIVYGGSSSGSTLTLDGTSNGSPVNANVLINPLNQGNVGIGTTVPHSSLAVVGLPVFANNAAAISGGLAAGDFYRDGGDPDHVCVVH